MIKKACFVSQCTDWSVLFKEKICSICGDDIDVDPISGWDGGHNAAPVNDGRCCTKCNTTVVVPRRIRDMCRATS